MDIETFFIPTIIACIFAIILFSLNVLIGGNSLHFEIALQNSFSINESLIDGVSAFIVLLIGIVSPSVYNLKIRITVDMDEILWISCGYLSYPLAIILAISLILCPPVQQIITYHSIIVKARKFANNRHSLKNHFNSA
jgi:hypothetical protein